MGVQLRAARTEDFAELYALDQACFAPGIAWSKAELRYFLSYPKSFGVVAEDKEGSIAGFAIGGIQRRGGQPVGRLITIDVREAARRRGIGDALIAAVEDRFLQVGATAVILEVSVENKGAQAFYRRHGYAPTGRIRGYYLGRIDALVMEKPLAPVGAG